MIIKINRKSYEFLPFAEPQKQPIFAANFGYGNKELKI